MRPGLVVLFEHGRFDLKWGEFDPDGAALYARPVEFDTE